MPAREDIARGGIRRDAAGNISLERVYLVEGLTGASSGLFHQAINDPAIPAIGTAHPDDASIEVLEQSGTPRDGSSMWITCRYGVPTTQSAPQNNTQSISIDAAPVEEDTIYDIFGQRFFAQYQGPETGGALVQQWPKGIVVRPLVTVTVTVFDDTVTDSALLDRCVKFVGHVNSTTWFGWPVKTWKCDDIIARRNYAEAVVSVDHIFTYNPGDWRLRADIIWGGRVPNDAVETNGFQFYDQYELADFNALPITIPAPVP